MGFRIASENFFASLAIWGCAIRIASHIDVASRDLGHKGASSGDWNFQARMSGVSRWAPFCVAYRPQIKLYQAILSSISSRIKL